MRRALVLGVVVAVALGAVAAFVAFGLSRDGAVPSVASPAGDPVVVGTVIQPSAGLAGDRLTADLTVTVDRTRVDPSSVEVGAFFRPFQRVEPTAVERTDVGETTVIRFRYPIQCIARGCAVDATERTFELPIGIVRYTVRGGDVVSLPLEWRRGHVSDPGSRIRSAPTRGSGLRRSRPSRATRCRRSFRRGERRRSGGGCGSQRLPARPRGCHPRAPRPSPAQAAGRAHRRDAGRRRRPHRAAGPRRGRRRQRPPRGARRPGAPPRARRPGRARAGGAPARLVGGGPRRRASGLGPSRGGHRAPEGRHDGSSRLARRSAGRAAILRAALTLRSPGGHAVPLADARLLRPAARRTAAGLRRDRRARGSRARRCVPRRASSDREARRARIRQGKHRRRARPLTERLRSRLPGDRPHPRRSYDVVREDGRIGLVVFSDTAEEALPPGTKSSPSSSRSSATSDRGRSVGVAAKPLYYRAAGPTEQALTRYPVSPWFGGFSGGTQISTGLRVARVALARDGGSGRVLLVSDLAEASDDLPRLTRELVAFQRSARPRSAGDRAAPGDGGGEGVFRRIGSGSAGSSIRSDSAPATRRPASQGGRLARRSSRRFSRLALVLGLRELLTEPLRFAPPERAGGRVVSRASDRVVAALAVLARSARARLGLAVLGTSARLQGSRARSGRHGRIRPGGWGSVYRRSRRRRLLGTGETRRYFDAVELARASTDTDRPTKRFSSCERGPRRRWSIVGRRRGARSCARARRTCSACFSSRTRSREGRAPRRYLEQAIGGVPGRRAARSLVRGGAKANLQLLQLIPPGRRSAARGTRGPSASSRGSGESGY